MDWLIEIGLFSGKAFIIVASLIIVLIVFFGLLTKLKPPKHVLTVEDLNKKYDSYNKQLRAMTEDHKLLKKELKKQFKLEKKNKKKSAPQDKRTVYILDFIGDIKASAAEAFRDEVTSILSVAKPERNDEVVVRLESTGGMVHAYGLAAAQLMRIKDQKLKLTICVDKVAASGGYMMACTADQILAAPFAIIGSIGVIAQVPNFHKLLKKHDVDYEEITAGEFKRTVSLLGEITEKGKQKFLEQIEDTHSLFKDFVQSHRPQLHIAQVATGEYWYGQRAKDLGLVDVLKTSDSYLFDMKDNVQLLKVSLEGRKKLGERLSEMMKTTVTHLFDHWIQKDYDTRFMNT